MQMKIIFQSTSNPENVKQSKTLNQIKGLLSIKHSDLKIRDYILVDKNQEAKTCKMMKKGFQSLKTNQQQVLHSENSQVLALKVLPR
jgi:hypothetical protein